MAWIEVDAAYKWLLTWMDASTIRAWSDRPPIARALQCIAHDKAEPRLKEKAGTKVGGPPAPSDSVSASEIRPVLAPTGIRTTKQRDAETECEKWLRAKAARDDIPSRGAVTKQAMTEFARLSGRAFERVWFRVAKDYPWISDPGQKRKKKPAPIQSNPLRDSN